MLEEYLRQNAAPKALNYSPSVVWWLALLTWTQGWRVQTRQRTMY
jgi:hypothetical protein